MPRAAEMPTRSPVKLPGPVVTAMRSRSANSMRPWSITRAITGISASAWPRVIRSVSRATIPPRPVSSTAAEQPSSAVSMARTRISDDSARAMDSGRRRIANGEQRIGLRSIRCHRSSARHRPDLDHVGEVVPQQVLDAVPQRRGRGWAARAGALHVEIDDAVLEAAEGDVAAVIGDRRPHPGLDQLLDGGDRLGIGGFEEFARAIGGGTGLAAAQQRRVGHEMLHDGAEDRGLELLPFARRLSDGDEVGAEENAGDAGDAEQALGERRLSGRVLVAHVERAAGEHRPSGQELEGGRIRGWLGLDEHWLAPSPAQQGFRPARADSHYSTWRFWAEVQAGRR